MGKGELGAMIGAAAIGLVGSFTLILLAGMTTSPLADLALRILAYTVPPVIAARVAYATGFSAGRASSHGPPPRLSDQSADFGSNFRER